jgi:hypothetical protein
MLSFMIRCKLYILKFTFLFLSVFEIFNVIFIYILTIHTCLNGL